LGGYFIKKNTAVARLGKWLTEREREMDPVVR